MKNIMRLFLISLLVVSGNSHAGAFATAKNAWTAGKGARAAWEAGKAFATHGNTRWAAKVGALAYLIPGTIIACGRSKTTPAQRAALQTKNIKKRSGYFAGSLGALGTSMDNGVHAVQEEYEAFRQDPDWKSAGRRLYNITLKPVVNYYTEKECGQVEGLPYPMSDEFTGYALKNDLITGNNYAEDPTGKVYTYNPNNPKESRVGAQVKLTSNINLTPAMSPYKASYGRLGTALTRCKDIVKTPACALNTLSSNINIINNAAALVTALRAI